MNKKINSISRKLLAISLVATTLGIGAQVIRASTQDTLRFSFVATATTAHGTSVLVGDRFTANIIFDLNSLSTDSFSSAEYKFDSAVSQFTLTAHPLNTGSWSPAGVTWNLSPAFNVYANANGNSVTVQLKSPNAPAINGRSFYDMQMSFGGDPRAFDAQNHTGTISLAQWLGTRNPNLSDADFSFELREDDPVNQMDYVSAAFTVSQLVINSTTTTSAPVSAITAASLPPADTSYRAGNKEVLVTWSSVSGAASYVVTNTNGVTQCTSTALSCTVSGLRNGKAYNYLVYSVNADGVRSTNGTQISVRPGFQIKKTSLKVNKKIRITTIASTPSKGAMTWQLTSGRCRIEANRLVTPNRAGSCRLRLAVKAKGSYPAMSTTVRITVTR